MQTDSNLFLYLLGGGWANPDPPHGGYMKIYTSPFMFRLIKRTAILLVFFLAFLAVLIPAGLDNHGDITKVINPAKAAWFFLWVQELTSYSKYMIYPVILLGLFFFFLPWLPGISHAKQAEWLPKDQKWINILTIIIFLLIVILSIIAMFFRGENWALKFYF